MKSSGESSKICGLKISSEAEIPAKSSSCSCHCARFSAGRNPVSLAIFSALCISSGKVISASSAARAKAACASSPSVSGEFSHAEIIAESLRIPNSAARCKSIATATYPLPASESKAICGKRTFVLGAFSFPVSCTNFSKAAYTEMEYSSSTRCKSAIKDCSCARARTNLSRLESTPSKSIAGGSKRRPVRIRGGTASISEKSSTSSPSPIFSNSWRKACPAAALAGTNSIDLPEAAASAAIAAIVENFSVPGGVSIISERPAATASTTPSSTVSWSPAPRSVSGERSSSKTGGKGCAESARRFSSPASAVKIPELFI